MSTVKELQDHAAQLNDVRIIDLFKSDPDRVKKMSLRLSCKDDMLYFDFSKNAITEDTIKLLVKSAQERHIPEGIEKMFAGEKLNKTENRAVLHVALRNRSNRPIYVDGKDVMPEVNHELEKVKNFSEKIRSGEWKGYTGKPITDVINIGIGGSDLGPKMVSQALTPYADPTKLKVHYISNVDATHAAEVLKRISPETCLFIISSKTFTTQV